MPSLKVTITVNHKDIPADRFVGVFIDSVVSGMVSALHDINEVRNINLSIEADDVNIEVNNDSLKLNRFVNKIIGNTVKGMVSSLKGVESIETLGIRITKQPS